MYYIRFWKYIYISGIKTRYSVSNLGEVKNRETGRMLIPYENRKGRMMVRLYLDGVAYDRQVHRLVGEFFELTRRSDQIQINHMDGDPSNNKLDNLEYCNNSENQLHTYRMGLNTAKEGEYHHMAKYDRTLIETICSLMTDHKSNSYIKNILNIPKHLVSDIRQRRAWTCVSKNYDF